MVETSKNLNTQAIELASQGCRSVHVARRSRRCI